MLITTLESILIVMSEHLWMPALLGGLTGLLIVNKFLNPFNAPSSKKIERSLKQNHKEKTDEKV